MLNAQDVHYVDKNATGSNDGSWRENTYTDLRDALAATEPDNEIWIAEGTYKPTDGTDRSISFEIPDNVSVYGGFAGTEIEPEERDVSKFTDMSRMVQYASLSTENYEKMPVCI